MELFTTFLEPLQLKETPISIATTDELMYIATQNSIYSIDNKNKLIKIYTTTNHRIKHIFTISDISIIIIVFEEKIEIRNLTDILNESDELFQSINIQITNLNIWNNMNSDHVIFSNDSNSDIMSLATVVNDETLNSHNDNNNDNNNNGSKDLISFLSLISKSQIIILKWINSKYSDRYNLYIPNIQFLQVVNINKLICISNSKPSDLITVNLEEPKILHYDISKLLNLKNSMIPFKNLNQINNISYFNNQLIILKYDEFININYPSLNDKNVTEKILNTNFKSSIIIFPFIFLIFDNLIEVRSISNFSLFQSIKLHSIGQLDFHNSLLSLISRDKFIVLKMLKYNQILEKLYILKDYDNAILLLENLNIENFIDDNQKSVNLKQMKFIKLRKFKLLRAINLLNTDSQSFNNFTKSMDLLIEFLASPDYVISNLPNDLKNLIENADDSEDLSKLHIFQINQLIKYLTDARRKLQRLLDNQFTVFNFNNLEISLSIYQDDDPKFSIPNNLRLLDNYLFKCYLLVNKKMISPFIRVNNYCDFELVEKKCTDLNLIDQLSTFYYTRDKYEKSVELLLKNHKDQELISFLQTLIQLENPPIDFIFQNINNENQFDLLFLNDNLDYSHIDYKKIIAHLYNWRKNNDSVLLKYLEYLFFHLKILTTEITNALFNIYLDDISENYNKIEQLYELGNYNANQVIKKLKNLPSSENLKRLMIPPLIKLGKYDDVLDIFVSDLNDIKGSVEFCIEIKNLKNDSLSRGLLFKLIDLCLKNKDYSSIVNYILNNSDLDYINFEEILIRLPSEISINLMSSFLIMNLKNLNYLNHNLIIKNELLKTNVINMKLNKMNLERKMNKLTQTSICMKCGKNFNTSEILCFHPNGNILHYKCSKTLS
jgi:hypothetical protein